MTAKPRTGHGAKPEAVREQAIVALLTEPSIGKAAAACGLGEKTLRRWLTEDADFQAEFEMARHATFKAALHRIPALTARAIATLAALLDDKEPPAVRLGAARSLVEVGLYQHDAETILKKLDVTGRPHDPRTSMGKHIARKHRGPDRRREYQ